MGNAPYIDEIDVAVSHPPLAPLYTAHTGGGGA